MKRAKILKKDIQTHGAELPELKLNEWISEGIAQNWWGKSERWVTELSGEDISNAIETREVEITPAILAEPGQVLSEAVLDEAGNVVTEAVIAVGGEVITPAVTSTQYKLAAEFEIVVEDLTKELEEKKKKENEKKPIKDKLKNLKKSDIKTVSELGDVLLDLLTTLDLK